MKPFNLAAAKAGAPIVRRDGKPAEFIAHVPQVLSERYRVIVIVDGILFTVAEDGSYANANMTETPHDLFMKTTKRTVYFNIYRCEELSQYSHGAVRWEDPESARKYAGPDALAVAVPIEIEE